MLSNKPICKKKVVVGDHCKLCPIEKVCNKKEANWNKKEDNWKELFFLNENKKRENLIKWCEKEYDSIVVG